MGVLIDSTLLIDAERSSEPVPDLLRRFGVKEDEEAYIAAMTATEILQGASRIAEKAKRRRTEAFVESVLGMFEVLPFDLIVARFHAQLVTELWRLGKPKPIMDVLIAATALANGLDVATRDRRSFPDNPGVLVRPHAPA